MSNRYIITRTLIILFVFHTYIPGLYGQSFNEINSEIRGTVYKSLEVYSNILNDKLNYSVYLPPYYHTSADSFPVLYLLHGFMGDETSWIDRTKIHIIIDSLISREEIPPLIVVMPDARNSYYINDYQLQFPYEDIFINEFIPFIDSTYKTLPYPGYRIIAGLSMGGFGAVINCIKHADVFGSCIALSAAVRTDEMTVNMKPEEYSSKFSHIYGSNLEGNDRITEHWVNNSPFYLINDSIADRLKSIDWYFDCGMNDFLINGNEILHQIFLKYNIPHEYHVRIGSHNWDYWHTGIIEGIRFAGQRLKEPGIYKK
jgi:enterochelin esterase-like enzyme